MAVQHWLRLGTYVLYIVVEDNGVGLDQVRKVS